MREQGYYAIIPANVRYDKDLIANAKLLYGEITCLSSKWGYAIATNEYFANLYNVSPRTITDWIKKLEDKKYIHTEVETKRYDDGTIKKERKIYINHIEMEQQNHIEVSLQNHIEENFAYNNNIYNNSYNNTSKELDNNKLLSKKDKKLHKTLEQFEEFWKLYPKKVDKKKAEGIYLKLEVEQETIVLGLKKYIKYLQDNKKEQYTKNPTTWLNGECWNDDYNVTLTPVQTRRYFN